MRTRLPLGSFLCQACPSASGLVSILDGQYHKPGLTKVREEMEFVVRIVPGSKT